MASVKKSTDNKQDFIQFIAQMNNTEINDYIKAHGKPPKKVAMYDIIDKSKRSFEECLISLKR